jgi:ABC-2 type transport system permease protein
MSKLLAIIKREYLQGVRSKTFLVSTIVGPILMAFFMIVPALLMGIKTGGATRIVVVDQTGRMYERVREAVMQQGIDINDDQSPQVVSTRDGSTQQLPKEAEILKAHYEIEEARLDGRAFDEVKRELNERIRQKRLDAYLILPPNLLENGTVEYYGRNLGDLFSIEQLRSRLSRVVIEQRMRDANINENRVRELSRRVEMSTVRVSESGEERSSAGSSFGLAIAVGTFIIIAILMYGQAILSAVVEEKTTRIIEVLFSSVRPFDLMAGKLVGVSLVALTQYLIWAVVFGGIALYGAALVVASGLDLPTITPSFVVYALIYFLLGFFIYATLYAIVGAMVTTEKEAGQIIIPVSFLLAFGIYLSFPVIRSPNSTFSFWVSMVPFFSPITMMVRIVTETPPFWQIALSMLIGIGTVIGLIWIAARIYRIGMLMYGKRASLPEVLRWIRQT